MDYDQVDLLKTGRCIFKRQFLHYDIGLICEKPATSSREYRK